ncbi:MAG: CRISPR-associated endonuclease Cas2 [Patescibacteria group bacterium]
MSLILDILNEMWDATLNYKGVTVNFFGVPYFKTKKQSSLRVTLSRLEKKKLIQKNNNGWEILEAGKKYLNEHNNLIKLQSPFDKSSPKNLILMFDIPEDMRQMRDWLRDQLKIYGYKMVQQSVWVGPSPLPQEFKKIINDLGMKKNIKTFKLASPYKQKIM